MSTPERVTKGPWQKQGPAERRNLVQTLNLTLREEMERDDRVVCMGQDVGKNGGVFRVTEGLQELYGEQRVIDTPLAESGIVGTAIGMAAFGLKPVAEIQFSAFTFLAFHQLRFHAAYMRSRSRGGWSVPMVLRTPYGGGIHALELHSEAEEALYVHTPGLKVVVPSDPANAKGLLLAAIRDPDPVVYLEPKRIYRAMRVDVPEGDYEIEIGKAATAREGSDVTIVSWGANVRFCLRVAEDLEEEGVSCEVIDLQTLAPLDRDAIVASVGKTGRCVVVQEAPLSCSMASEIISVINEEALYSLQAPVVRVGAPDVPYPLYQLEGQYLPDEERIRAAVKQALEG